MCEIVNLVKQTDPGGFVCTRGRKTTIPSHHSSGDVADAAARHGKARMMSFSTHYKWKMSQQHPANSNIKINERRTAKPALRGVFGDTISNSQWHAIKKLAVKNGTPGPPSGPVPPSLAHLQHHLRQEKVAFEPRENTPLSASWVDKNVGICFHIFRARTRKESSFFF